MKTSLTLVKEKLLKNDVFPGCQYDYESCLSNPLMCEKLKCAIKQLMN